MTVSAEPLALALSQQKRVPDFFIVGHAKCGTTALYEMLRRHPQIYMPDVKEPWFFARNPQTDESDKRLKTFEQTGVSSETLDEYLSLFDAASPDQRVGEASTHYLWSRTAAAAIADVQPAARIIAILREPAGFLRSLHLQLLQNHHECEKDFRKAIALEAARREGREIPSDSSWPRALLYSDRVRYVEQLRRFHAVFPPEQILVLIYDDFQRDNEATVRAVLRFLGVDDSSAIHAVEANPTVRVRSVRLDRMTRALFAGQSPLSRAVRATGRALTPQRLRQDVFYPIRRRVVYGKPRSADEEFTLELRRRFKGEVVALSEYLGRDLVTLWGYHDVD
jgi:hypothetical protein